MIDGLVSVITPMYNAENWIKETIRSVQAQSYNMWEMIIVDDCSTDRSMEIVKKLQTEDRRIKYYCNKINSGVAITRNNAIKYAKGRYLAFLDSDDVWRSDKLQKQIEKMKKEQKAFCYSACEVIDEHGNRINVRYVPESVNYQELLKGNIIPCLTVVLDRWIIKNVSMPKMPHEDYATWLKIFQSGIQACGINEPLASYRVVSSSVSNNKFKAMRWTWYIYRQFLGLDFIKSCYCFCFYVWNAIKKRR